MVCMISSHLACSDVSVTFGDHHVLKDVSLTTSPGRVHALLGPNGAGKSTLMSVLLGLIKPDHGNVTLMGQPFKRSQLRLVGASINDPAFTVTSVPATICEYTQHCLACRIRRQTG